MPQRVFFRGPPMRKEGILAILRGVDLEMLGLVVQQADQLAACSGFQQRLVGHVVPVRPFHVRSVNISVFVAQAQVHAVLGHIAHHGRLPGPVREHVVHVEIAAKHLQRLKEQIGSRERLLGRIDAARARSHDFVGRCPRP
ncbi:hypothetical protein P4H39_15000 [Paenibacillus lautus]|uniref:hypothetical protein n=1 Tax=Paenibacillus lautus TaxID=1401 RepID=UPI002DBCCAD9|nr:hypothetical protein [Paenibacillus lautus]MEC0203950.1 hypothetical protein [Paenibacillus lautus]